MLMTEKVILFQGEAVRLISEGKAPNVPQWEGGATYDQIWQKKEVAEINWDQPALQLHNFIRGSDKIPGAWSRIDEQVQSSCQCALCTVHHKFCCLSLSNQSFYRLIATYGMVVG